MIHRCTLPVLGMLIILASPGGRAQELWRTVEEDGITLRFTDADSTDAAKVLDYCRQGKVRVEEFFGEEFPSTIQVRLFPTRAALTEFWREAWGAPSLDPECWMVASGTASMLSALTPRVWATEACEHDARDTAGTRMLFSHELCHVFHGMRGSSPEFEGMDDIGWFVEGLATYVSGQYDARHLNAARDAFREGKEPHALRTAWSGRYRYGVCASIVEFIDVKYGKEKIREMLRGVTEGDLLGMLGTTEADLLAGWRGWVVANFRGE